MPDSTGGIRAGGDWKRHGCAHVRRKFYELHPAPASPMAAEALKRIGALYALEDEVRGRWPEERAAVRRARAGPFLTARHDWVQATARQLAQKSALAGAIRYALGRWVALTR